MQQLQVSGTWEVSYFNSVQSAQTLVLQARRQKSAPLLLSWDSTADFCLQSVRNPGDEYRKNGKVKCCTEIDHQEAGFGHGQNLSVPEPYEGPPAQLVPSVISGLL